MRTLLAVSALVLAAASPAAAQGLTFRSVVVDAAPIAADGYPTFAHRVEAAVAPAVQEAFAGSVNPADPRGLTLVFRVFSVKLPVYTGSSREGENDFMRAEALVVDPRGRVVTTAAVLAPATSWTNVASLPVEVEEGRRMRTLGRNAAYWLRGRLGAGL